MRRTNRAVATLTLLTFSLAAGTAWAQPGGFWRDDVDYIVPSARRVIFQQRPIVQLDSVAVKITIDGPVAVTELELSITNPTGTAREAELMLPVPDGAAVRSLQYDGTGPEPTAKLLPRDEARRIYDSIVASMRDPALLEFAGHNVIRTSAFPVPPGATQKLRVTFEQVLTVTGGRTDWVLPRTESLAGSVPWSLSATVRSAEPIAGVFSPSHDLQTTRTGAGSITATASGAALTHAGSLRLSILRDTRAQAEPVATVFATPDPDAPGSGYFMMLVSLPQASRPKVAREVTLVLDRSGSMQGEKFTQALGAAQHVVGALQDGDLINIVDYSDGISAFKTAPVRLTPAVQAEALAYLRTLAANGGTNIRDALVEALRPAPQPETLPMILFLTDGRPTVGECAEDAIRAAARAANLPSGNAKARRIFSFGLGWDVNSPLLTALARDARGTTTLVQPDENTEVKVSQVFDRLSGPTLASPSLAVLGADRETPGTSLLDIMPQQLPDYFAGEQVILTGRYRGPASVRIDGELHGRPTTVRFDVPTADASLSHAFVSRAWATQRVAWLVEQLRTNFAGKDVRTDPAGKELVDEIVRLSTKFGILTEYTAFLSTEPGRQFNRLTLNDEVGRNMQLLNDTRAGAGAFSQDLDAARKNIATGAVGLSSNSVYRLEGNRLVETRLPVQNVANRAFFQRNDRWTQGELIERESDKPDLEIASGTPEYAAISDELIADGLAPVLALPGKVLIRHRQRLVMLTNTVQ